MKRLILLVLLTIPIFAQNSELKPIPITDETTKKTISDSYKILLAADKDFQIALLKAKLKYKVDESWNLDLSTLTFIPPPKASKEEKKP